MNDEILHIRITGESLDDLRNFVDQTQIDLGCRAIAIRNEQGFVIDGWLSEKELSEAEQARTAAGVKIDVVENATQTGRQRQQEVGRGNRFASRGEIPKGLGQKTEQGGSS